MKNFKEDANFNIPGRVSNQHGVYNSVLTSNGLLITHRDPKTGELWADNKVDDKDDKIGCWVPVDSVRLDGLIH